jgi:hypothetical protein
MKWIFDSREEPAGAWHGISYERGSEMDAANVAGEEVRGALSADEGQIGPVGQFVETWRAMQDACDSLPVDDNDRHGGGLLASLLGI